MPHSASSYSLVAAAVGNRRPDHNLPRHLYVTTEAFEADLKAIFCKDWLFVCHASELPRAGDFQRFDLADHSLIILRGRDGAVRAVHNVCRHRGARLCEKTAGRAANLVCPYHQWIYDLTGTLTQARDMGGNFDKASHNLRQAHCQVLEGCVFVCLAEDAPDFEPFATAARPYLKAHGLANARVAHVSTIVEQGNWKLTWENYHECYHCDQGHPELGKSFPVQPVDYGGAKDAEADDFKSIRQACDAQGLPHETRGTDDGISHRFYRRPLLTNSMTMSGEPAVQKSMGMISRDGIGSVSVLHHPNLFGHLLGDHALFIRLVPLATGQTQLQTRWLVHEDAVEGQDYDLKTLTEVWLATNEQDARFVELAQQGVNSPAFEPGPYSPTRETSPNAFNDWYCDRLRRFLNES